MAQASDWLTTREAAEVLCMEPEALCRNRGMRAGIRVEEPREIRWHRGDCEEVSRIVRECRIPRAAASRVLQAKREGRL